MANLQEIIPAFFTGPGGARLTPEQIAQRQAVAQSLMAQATDTSPNAGGWTSVIAKGLMGGIGGWKEGQAERAGVANAEASQSRIAQMLSGMGGTPAPSAFPSAVAAGASPTSGIATGTAMPIPEAPEIRQKLLDRGLPSHVADGFILNFQDESGLNPGINEQNPTVPGSRGGFGLYQLTGPRRREYEAFAQQRGVPVDDVDAQLDFMMQEGSGSEKAAFDKILAAPDTATAAQAIVSDFLRPAPGHRQARMARYANAPTSPVQDIAIDPTSRVAAAFDASQAPATAVDAINTVAPPMAAPVNVAEMPVASVPQSGAPMGAGSPGEIRVGPDGQSYQYAETTGMAGDQGGQGWIRVNSAPSENLLAQNDMALGGALSPTGQSSVAQALTGYFPDAPNAMQTAATQQAAPAPAGINPAIIQALSDPYATDQERQVAGMLLQQQQAAQDQEAQRNNWLFQQQYQEQAQNRDPLRQAQLAEIQRKATAQPEVFRQITGQEAAQAGLDPNKSYNVGPDGKVTAIGDAGVTVNNNMGGNKFDEKFAEADAKTLNDVSTSGLAAQRNLGRIDQLGQLLEASPNGLSALAQQAAGEWGINTEGLDTIQATQAVINSLVPEQRPAGSGPMSDADLALFKQSLPRIINTPGGNQMIVNVMRGVAQYDAEGAAIVQRLRAGEISRSKAFEDLQARPNPLAGFKPPGSGGNASSTDGAKKTSTGVQWSID